MKCKKCGNEINENNKFCGNCGAANLKDNIDNKENKNHIEKREKTDLPMIVVYVVVGFILVLLLLYRFNGIYSIINIFRTSHYDVGKFEIECNKNCDHKSGSYYNTGEVFEVSDGKASLETLSTDFLRYYSLSDYVDRIKDNCNDGCNVIEDITKLEINDVTWYKLTLNENKYTDMYLFTEDNGRIYRFVYSVKEKYYDIKHQKEIKKMYSTITYIDDNEEDYDE